MKPLQYFSEEYLQRTSQATPAQILTFLEQYRLLQGAEPVKPQSRLISMKVPEDMLQAFRSKCELSGAKYQTQIKRLMHEWLEQ